MSVGNGILIANFGKVGSLGTLNLTPFVFNLLSNADILTLISIFGSGILGIVKFKDSVGVGILIVNFGNDGILGVLNLIPFAFNLLNNADILILISILGSGILGIVKFKDSVGNGILIANFGRVGILGILNLTPFAFNLFNNTDIFPLILIEGRGILGKTQGQIII